ncbi:MAG TPA: NADH-quinone oxidoreductase subunit L [Rickettsiales bacterium]|nr:NADH-quinone oxidoreductase subunit L [Rickettsiales bacterium]
METSCLATAVLFLPLIAAVLVGVFVRVIPARLAQLITCGALVTSAVCAGFVFHDVALLGHVQKIKLLEWIDSGDFNVSWAIRVDALTAVMLVVVTWVSSVVHIYSVGYMSHDEHRQRFMAYLSLFTFFMLMLVTSDNLIQLFLGWEGVGLCSYLLIGFWYKKPEANAAAIKAFIVNRVGDFGFALGVAATFLLFGSVQFDVIFGNAAAHAGDTMNFLGNSYHALTLICFLLFIGAMGKSAQLGLHTWLPDAMEGPTPVSALIHAATMVTAGVFLVARCSPLFEQAPSALEFVTVIGALTAFFAASVGLVQNDIKRVIAYSTCSQLGYMFFACGVGAYSAGVFHLMTHAFFKALLFLGAGSVIHAMSGEQDMRNMGGIWKKIPVTYIYMWLGSLALAGMPFFAGYYSKDMILEAAYAAGTRVGEFAYWMGIVAAFMTAFYSWRLLFMTFHGKPRASHDVMHHVHESPAVMLVPLLLLAAGAIAAGYIGRNMLGMVAPEGEFWAGAIKFSESHNVLEAAEHIPHWAGQLPGLVGISGITLAFVFYILAPSIPHKLAEAFRPIYLFLLNKWYFDEAYDVIFVQTAKRFGAHLWKFWDTKVIDGLGPNGAAWVSAQFGKCASRLQTGYLYHYAFAMLIGLVFIASSVLFMAGGH